jgi:lipopolysaccharide transport system permease protein
LTGLWRHRQLLAQLIRRDVAGRYRGSRLGVFWSFFNPLLTLAVYTFAFGVVFKAKWSGSRSDSLLEFATMLFAGLIVFTLFAECATRAPGIVLAHANFVKKVVFPLEVLPVMLLGSALFHAAASLVILVLGILFAYGAVPWTVLLFPFVILPVALLSLGMAWLLASLGVFLRDIGQVIGVLVTALLFLSPIFFPLAALPSAVRPWIELNPLAFPIEEARQVLVLGNLPNWAGVALYSAVALAVAAAGHAWFVRTKRAFADVM